MGSAVLTNAIATQVDGNHPTTNLNSTSYLGMRTGGVGTSYALIYFSRPFPLGATILSATITYYMTDIPESGTHTITWQRLNQSFSASKVTYNTRPTSLISGTKAQSKVGSQPERSEWVVDITDWMQTISNGGVNYGFRVSYNQSFRHSIYSEVNVAELYRPRLEITWSDVPETPSGLSPGGGRAVDMAKPVLKTVYRDHSGSTQLAAIQVQINSTDVWTSPSFDSGTVLTSVPELDLATTAYAGLADGATTFWRVRLQDAAGLWSAWSASTSFKRETKGALTLNNPPVGSTPAFGSETVVAEATAGNIIVTVPSGVVANSVVLVYIYLENSALTVTPPAGYSVITDNSYGTTNNQRVLTYWHRASGAESGTVTFTLSGTTWRGAKARRVDGAKTTSNPYELSEVAGDAGPTTVTPPVSLDGTTPGSLLWYIWTANPGAGGVPVNTPPSGFAGFTYTNNMSDAYRPNLLGGDTGDLAGVFVSATGSRVGVIISILGSGTGPIVEDATPPLAWSFSGETQAAYQVQVKHVDNNVDKVDWDTGKVTGTITSITVPAGAINEPSSTVYTLTVRIWDNKQREATPGDPTYVEVVRQFVFFPGATTGTTGLTAVPDATGRPKVTLQWSAATFPDRFNILRNNKVIAAGLDPNDTFVSGTTHTYVDESPSPQRLLTYQVQRVVNNIASASNATASCTVTTQGIWLREPASGLELCIRGREDQNFILGEQGVVLQSIAQDSNKVAINQSLGGLEGKIEGHLVGQLGLTAEQWRDQYLQMRALRVKRFWLTIKDYTFEVVCQGFTYSPVDVPGIPFYRISFDFYQQNSVSTLLSTS